jgi:hypothetical protein
MWGADGLTPPPSAVISPYHRVSLVACGVFMLSLHANIVSIRNEFMMDMAEFDVLADTAWQVGGVK